MTWWGGREVAQFAEVAGFRGENIKRAVAISWATSRFADHHQLDAQGLPSHDQYGLFGLSPSTTAIDAHELYNPVTNARALIQLWELAGHDWRVTHPVVTHRRGLTITVAWRTLTEHDLWMKSADDMGPVTEPIGARFATRSPDQMLREAHPLG